MRERIAAAAADRSAEIDDVRMVAFAFAGALNWPARWYLPDGPVGAEQMAADLVEILCRGIEPRTARKGE